MTNFSLALFVDSWMLFSHASLLSLLHFICVEIAFLLLVNYKLREILSIYGYLVRTLVRFIMLQGHPTRNVMCLEPESRDSDNNSLNL